MKNNKEKTNVFVDDELNRLYINLVGSIRKEDIEQIYIDIKDGVKDLKTGFDVVTDLRQCRLGHLAGVPTFRKIMGYLSANGVNRVVRIVGKSKIVFKQISRITDSESRYSPIYVSTFEEMEELLAKEMDNELIGNQVFHR